MKTKYQIRHWSTWPMKGEPSPSEGMYYLTQSPKGEVFSMRETSSIEEIVNELPNLGIDEKDVTICLALSVDEWRKLVSHGE